MSLDGRIAIVTGGTKGVGRGIGRELARHGARVFVTGRTAPDHESLDERITGIRCDHRLDSDVKRAFNLIVREANAIDRSAAEGPRLLLAKKVRDAITRDAKKAAGYVLNRHQQAIGFYLRRRPPARCPGRVGCIGHTPAVESAQPGRLFRDDFGDSTVVLGHRGDARWHHASIPCRRTAAANIVEI